MNPWLDPETGRTYESPQAYVDEAIRFDDVREGGWFMLFDKEARLTKHFRVEHGKAIQK